MSADPYNLPSHHDTMKARITKILLEVPNSRSNDDVLIITFWRRHWLLVYNEATKKLNFRDPAGITYDEALHMPSTESICRIKRDIQLEARERMLHGKASADDANVLPSERVAEQRVILEGINKQYFWRG